MATVHGKALMFALRKQISDVIGHVHLHALVAVCGVGVARPKLLDLISQPVNASCLHAPRRQLTSFRLGGPFPKFRIVRKLVERVVVARWLEPRKRYPYDHIDDGRRVLHIEINRLKPMSKVELWVIVQSTALKPFAPICYSPTHQITEDIVVEMKSESDTVIE